MDSPELEAIRQKKIRMLQEMASRPPLPSTPVTLTDSTFARALTDYPNLVIDMWAPWCGPCKMVGPVVEQLAREFSGQVVMGKMSVDENPQVAGRFAIMSIPTMLYFRNSRMIHKTVGVQNAQTMRGLLRRLYPTEE